jgi:gas vesicle protein
MAMNDSNGNKSLMSLLFGAALGATALYLSDRNNRDKVKRKWGELKEEGSDKVDELKDKIDRTKDKVKQETREMEERMNEGP